MFFLVSVEMLNYTGLATVQGGRIGPVGLSQVVDKYM